VTTHGTGAGIDEGLAVRLRPAVDADATRWLEMLQDPEQRRLGSPAFVPVPNGVDDLAEALERSRSTWAERAPGTLVVADVADRFLGDVSWRWTTGEQLGVADLGYVVHPDARGRGVARSAIVLLTRWLLDEAGRGLARVQLDHSTENPASCRVALAAGFAQEGIRRGFLPLRGDDGVVRRHDVCLHGRVTAPPLPGRTGPDQ